ncbi:hypothetical protein TNCV_4622301 [Trichonephila clavipes]|nr:hypothetical protein TNCV_4622301 [Trichonephila clavipes]
MIVLSVLSNCPAVYYRFFGGEQPSGAHLTYVRCPRKLSGIEGFPFFNGSDGGRLLVMVTDSWSACQELEPKCR